MTWANEQRQELSRKVAEKFSLKPARLASDFPYETIWLHDDWHTIMNLCVKHGVYAYHDEYVNDTKDGTYKLATAQVYAIDKSFDVPYLDCNNDPYLTERIARMMALMEVTV